MSNKKLWTEFYRPKTIDGYVFKDLTLRRQVQSWIKDKFIPHLLLSGGSGCGKSTLAWILVNELKIDNGDIMYINASSENGIDAVRDKIQNFVMTIPNGDFKVVILDEADGISPAGQGALRRILEDYSDNARFIFCCNYLNKIIPAIKSRCQEIVFKELDIDEFRIRVAEILAAENVEFDLDTLDSYVKATHPDLRKCINNVQLNTHEGVLINVANSESTADWQVSAVDLFKAGRITEARKLICDQIRPEEFEDFFRLCYKNLDWWGKTSEDQDVAIIIIRDALVKHSCVADPEINVAAMLVELSNIGK